MPLKNPELLPLFEELRELLEPYSSGLVVEQPEPGRFELWSTVDIALSGTRTRRPYFAGLIVQKSYVGFYYMPLYAENELSEVFDPELLSLLKGKSCFHVKELDDQLEQQIRKALKIGFKLYKERNWV